MARGSLLFTYLPLLDLNLHPFSFIFVLFSGGHGRAANNTQVVNNNNAVEWSLLLYESNYSRMDQVKFVEVSKNLLGPF